MNTPIQGTWCKAVAATFLLVASATSLANQTPTLAQIDAAVAQKATQMDSDFGVLLSHQEQSNLKTAIIAKAVAAQLAQAKINGETLTVKQAVEQAFEKYQINDSYQQRQLIIGVEAAKDGGLGSGNEPPK